MSLFMGIIKIRSAYGKFMALQKRYVILKGDMLVEYKEMTKTVYIYSTSRLYIYMTLNDEKRRGELI